MKRLIALLIFILALNTSFAKKEDVTTVTHFSKYLNSEKSFRIYIPPDAKPGEKFPVLFIMHGAYGSFKDWTDKTNVAELADGFRMILVFPDGGEFGWYVDSPYEKDSQYESYIAKELVAYIDKTYPTVAQKEGRAIMGLSMGGHGALMLSVKHPDVFGSASSMSGILRISNHPEKWQIAGRLGPYSENKKIWESNSVWDLAEGFTTSSVKLLFDCGVDDTGTGAIADGRETHQKLVSLKVPHIWRELAGSHSWEYWQTHLEEHLNFHQAAMLAQTPKPNKFFEWYFGRLGEFYKENADLAINKPDKKTLCLLGSSSIQGMSAKLFPDYRVFNRGISGDRLGIGSKGISHRLEESVFDMKPDYIVIKNGRNDLTARHKDGEPSIARMIEEYSKIIETIKKRLPESKILILTSFPVRDKYAHLAPAIMPYNQQLITLAKKLDVPIIDAHKELVGNDGLLKPENSADGLHLSEKGKQIVADLINKHFAK